MGRWVYTSKILSNTSESDSVLLLYKILGNITTFLIGIKVFGFINITQESVNNYIILTFGRVCEQHQVFFLSAPSVGLTGVSVFSGLPVLGNNLSDE
jgi:hypothetical protein